MLFTRADRAPWIKTRNEIVFFQLNPEEVVTFRVFLLGSGRIRMRRFRACNLCFRSGISREGERQQNKIQVPDTVLFEHGNPPRNKVYCSLCHLVFETLFYRSKSSSYSPYEVNYPCFRRLTDLFQSTWSTSKPDVFERQKTLLFPIPCTKKCCALKQLA